MASLAERCIENRVKNVQSIGHPQILKIRYSFLHIFLGGLMAMLAWTACAVELPDFGDSSGTVISPEKERQLGAAFLRSLRGRGAILEDLETQEYLQELGDKLVQHSDGAGQEFTFFPIASMEINAFAAPGGFIGVNAGLILNSTNESELAGVLAHEISHVTQRHMARTFERAGQMSLPVAIAMIGSLLLGVASPDAGLAAMTAVQAGTVQNQIDFTRANEQEADRIGMALLYRSGFDPSGMPSFFERLQVATRLTDPKSLPEFLRTHPVTVSRIADAKNRLKEFPPRRYKDSDAYRLTKARIRVAAAKSPRHAVKIFAAELKEGNFEKEDPIRYGYVLALIHAGKYKKARRELKRLLKKEGTNASYLLAQAELERGARNYRKSLQIYDRLEKLYPGYRPVVLNHVKMLLQNNRAQEAKQRLLDYALQHGPDRIYYELLAEAEGRSGSKIEAQLALAEYYYLSGDTRMARDQLKIAEKNPDLDYYHKQRLLARLEEFEKELAEEKKLHKR